MLCVTGTEVTLLSSRRSRKLEGCVSHQAQHGLWGVELLGHEWLRAGGGGWSLGASATCWPRGGPGGAAAAAAAAAVVVLVLVEGVGAGAVGSAPVSAAAISVG